MQRSAATGRTVPCACSFRGPKNGEVCEGLHAKILVAQGLQESTPMNVNAWARVRPCNNHEREVRGTPRLSVQSRPRLAPPPPSALPAVFLASARLTPTVPGPVPGAQVALPRADLEHRLEHAIPVVCLPARERLGSYHWPHRVPNLDVLLGLHDPGP